MKFIALITLLFCSFLTQAQNVLVQDAWVRATVPGQRATGAFMKITAHEGATLVGASSAAAGVAQVHEMKLEGGVMKMRAVAHGLDLPAGLAVELKPGGYHVMLMDLKAPLEEGTRVALTLLFTNAAGQPSQLELQLPVSKFAPGASTVMDHSQHKS